MSTAPPPGPSNAALVLIETSSDAGAPVDAGRGRPKPRRGVPKSKDSALDREIRAVFGTSGGKDAPPKNEPSTDSPY